MATMIATYPRVKVLSVSKLSEMDYDEWRWREDLVGQIGSVEIYQVARKILNRHFILFDSDSDFYLNTCRGEAQISDHRIDLITRNTKYVFEILPEDRQHDGASGDRDEQSEKEG